MAYFRIIFYGSLFIHQYSFILLYCFYLINLTNFFVVYLSVNTLYTSLLKTKFKTSKTHHKNKIKQYKTGFYGDKDQIQIQIPLIMCTKDCSHHSINSLLIFYVNLYKINILVMTQDICPSLCAYVEKCIKYTTFLRSHIIFYITFQQKTH